ncbi:hypothetical protein ACQEU3_47155 [Spirillospora sp. CA-253888]
MAAPLKAGTQAEYQRARIRALATLARTYPGDFAPLYASEQAKEQQPLDVAAKARARQRARAHLSRTHDTVYRALLAEELAKEATR